MNRTTAVTLVIIVVIIVGGLLLYMNRGTTLPTYNATSTTSEVSTGVGQDNTTSTSPSGQRTAGAPTVGGNSTVTSSDTSAVIQGSVTPNGAATTYWYEYGTTANFGSSISQQTIGSGYTAIPTPGYITGLKANTTYYFRLVAQNPLGITRSEQRSFKTTQGNPPLVGGLPTAKTATASEITRTTANINGQVNPDKAATTYWFEFGKTNGLGNTTSFASVGSGSATVAAIGSLSGLEPSTTYYYRVNAQNQFGTVNGSILSFKTAGPAESKAPTAVTNAATAIKTTSATLNGTVDPNNSETSYWFEYGTDSLLDSVLIKSTTHRSAGSGSTDVATNATISSLNGNSTYYYRLVAQSSQGIVHGAILSFSTK
jgi:phosphodiesterase/alkaline phosphatase D-like protein